MLYYKHRQEIRNIMGLQCKGKSINRLVKDLSCIVIKQETIYLYELYMILK